MSNESGIIVCGVCKNVVSTLPVIRAAFEDLASKAGVPCWAIFYENNSEDGTDVELMRWASEAPDQVRVQCDKFTREEELSRCVARTYDNKPCRMEQIAHARNKLLDMLEGNQSFYRGAKPTGTTAPPTGPPEREAGSMGKCDEGGVWGTVGSLPRYVVMIDTDNPVPFPVNAILKCIARDPDGFDALVCNGLNPMGYMYDTYAYRDAQVPFGPEIMREAFWSGQHQSYVQTAVHNKTIFHNRLMRQNPALLPYIPIASGFNGLCIFRREAITGIRYSALPTAEMNAEYEEMKCIPPLAKHANTHLNGASVGIYLFPKAKTHQTAHNAKVMEEKEEKQDKEEKEEKDDKKEEKQDKEDKSIFYFHNSGYNFPVVCEHVPFFAAMRAQNCRRIYLCTDLVWNWL